MRTFRINVIQLLHKKNLKDQQFDDLFITKRIPSSEKESGVIYVRPTHKVGQGDKRIRLIVFTSCVKCWHRKSVARKCANTCYKKAADSRKHNPKYF